VGQIIALPPKFNVDLFSDKKVIIYWCKRGFFVGICIEKGARSSVGKSKRNGRVVYQQARRS